MEPERKADNSPENEAPQTDKEHFVQVSRFASTFAGAFRAFFLYRNDNKALDEIMNNVVSRFDGCTSDETQDITIGTTHQSLTFEGEAVGFKEVTIHLAATLYQLGVKSIHFRKPLQGRHFFALLNILSNKDSQEVKLEKLIPYFSQEENQPISLTALTSRSMALRISDDQIKSTFSILTDPEDSQSVAFMRKLKITELTTPLDALTFLRSQLPNLDDRVKNILSVLVDSTQEGYFPTLRFLNLFPFPDELREKLIKRAKPLPYQYPPRRETALGQHFSLAQKNDLCTPTLFCFTNFDERDTKARNEMVQSGGRSSSAEDLAFAQSLMKEKGPNFKMGLRFLLKILENENTVIVQEKALKLGIGIWTRYQKVETDLQLISLFSSLRQKLSAPHNIAIFLHPLRSLTIESDLFKRMGLFLNSLGEPVIPALLEALGAEEDRSMRKKLILIITDLSRKNGQEILIESMEGASHFLLRNIINILGDIKSKAAIDGIGSQINHSAKIVRTEAIRSLSKIGSKESLDRLYLAIGQSSEKDAKMLIINLLATHKDTRILTTIQRYLDDGKTTATEKQVLYQSLGSIGGVKAKQLLEAQLDKPAPSSLFGGKDTEHEANMNAVKNVLRRMA